LVFYRVERLNNLFIVSSELGMVKEISFMAQGWFKDRNLKVVMSCKSYDLLYICI
jgi:hypothetical protein